MEVEYARHYRDLHERHWWFHARQRLLERELRSRLWDGGHSPGDDGVGPILDIGAGDGLFLPTLANFGEPEGLEPESAAVSSATRERFTIYVQPFDAAFQPGKSYGLITMLDVLEHLDDDVGALRHAAALLRPDGIMILTVPALRLLWTRHDDLNHHRTRYTRRTLLRCVEAAGLRLIDCRYFFHWLFPVKLLVRAAEWVRRAEPRLPEVPQEPWNRIFYRLTCLEQDSLTRLRLPVGSSILATVVPL